MVRVAVLLPTYQSEPYLVETLAAIHEQTYQDYVVIAVDDASTDGTLDLLLSARERDPAKWHILRNRHNLGMTGNWNRCVAIQRQVAAHADYIIKIDSDDVPDSRLLQRAVSELDSDAEAALCHFRLQLMGGASICKQESAMTRVLARHGWSLAETHKMPSAVALWLMIRYDNFIASSGIVFRKEALERLTLPWFDEAFTWAADFELWSRLAALGPLRYVSEVPVAYRVRLDSVTGNTDRLRRQREVWRIGIRAFGRSYKELGPTNVLRLVPIVAYKLWLLYKWRAG